MEKKPILFLFFKLLGLVGLGMLIFGVIKLVNGFGQFNDNSFLVGMLMMPFGLFLGFTGLTIGFRPEMTKHSIKTAKYIQEDNKEDLKEMLSTTAEIHSEAVTTTAKAIKAGMTDTMYCKHCGQKIDADSKFCKHCGKEL